MKNTTFQLVFFLAVMTCVIVGALAFWKPELLRERGPRIETSTLPDGRQIECAWIGVRLINCKW